MYQPKDKIQLYTPLFGNGEEFEAWTDGVILYSELRPDPFEGNLTERVGIRLTNGRRFDNIMASRVRRK